MASALEEIKSDYRLFHLLNKPFQFLSLKISRCKYASHSYIGSIRHRNVLFHLLLSVEHLLQAVGWFCLMIQHLLNRFRIWICFDIQRLGFQNLRLSPTLTSCFRPFILVFNFIFRRKAAAQRQG